MFYLPGDWLGPLSRMLSIPFAPAGWYSRILTYYANNVGESMVNDNDIFGFLGSVSVLFWFYACKNIVRRCLTGMDKASHRPGRVES